MEKTTNYKLPRWEKDDFVKMDDFNAAFQTIDETLKAGADAVADEAAARETAVTALAQDVGSGGRVCRITTGSYTGNGKTGETNKRTISVDFTPVLVAVVSEGDITGNYGYTPMLLLRGCTTASRNTAPGTWTSPACWPSTTSTPSPAAAPRRRSVGEQKASRGTPVMT